MSFTKNMSFIFLCFRCSLSDLDFRLISFVASICALCNVRGGKNFKKYILTMLVSLIQQKRRQREKQDNFWFFRLQFRIAIFETFVNKADI